MTRHQRPAEARVRSSRETAHLHGYLALLCVLLACRTASQSERVDADSVRTTPRAALEANADSVATTTQAAARGFVLQADSTCGLSSSADHANPAELVQEYLRRDGAGQFLRQDVWFAGAMMCPHHVPGWDLSTLISGHEVNALTVDDTSAAFEVRYTRLGLLSQDSEGFYLIENPGVKTDTFRLLKSQFGWRIDSPVMHQHILPQAALGLRRLRPESRQRITELMTSGKR